MDALHVTETTSAGATKPLIEARGLGFKVRAGAGEINILRGLDLRVNAGEAVGIVGPSGSGKTSLLMLLAGLERADLVIGSRNCQGSSLVENWPRHRLLISRMAGTLVELCPGAPVRDTTIGYRCWSREL